MDCYVYVLGTVTPNRHLTYVGWTDDVTRRLTQHNSRQGRSLDPWPHMGTALF